MRGRIAAPWRFDRCPPWVFWLSWRIVQSKFYSPDQHRAEKVRELFATIASRYDLLNGLMSFGRNLHWKLRLVEMAEEKGEEGRAKGGGRQQKLVLDLCCGTGDIARMFARRGACVTGVDFTAEMLQVAINSRHQDALNRARQSTHQAAAALAADATLELVAMDLRIAANAVGEIVGKTTTDDLLDSIFSQFCIGK